MKTNEFIIKKKSIIYELTLKNSLANNSEMIGTLYFDYYYVFCGRTRFGVVFRAVLQNWVSFKIMLLKKKNRGY